MDLDLNRIIQGNCLDVLKTLPDNTFDSCVSDVPYGLGPKEPTLEEIIAYLQGEELDTGGDFMGKKWFIPSVNVWREVFRVLKPGAHVLAFGGTRTWDLISMGLRAAGFENRDTIADNHPAIQWLYASGMPKSTNVSKQFLKKAEKLQAVPEVDRTTEQEEALSELIQVAETWKNWGTGLKPSWEPILVFRKPFKGPLFQNVLEHGTGALNIDATRVAHANAADLEEHKKQVEAVKAKGGVRGDSWKNSSDLSGANDVNEGGRWPANMVMTHHPDCNLIEGAGGHHWDCAPGCPIAALDTQSGDRPSTLTGMADPSKSHAHPGTEFNPNSTFLGERTHHSAVYADAGGASRFFKQFMAELDLPFLYTTKANRMKASGGEFKVTHPTLKPVELMQYLVKLVTPKGGIVLDPYCGSGSTCHAALLERCFYIGIELGANGEYDEAVKRMEAIHRQVEDSQAQEDMFAFAMGELDDE